MGIILHDDGKGGGRKNKLYELMEGGRGVMISLEEKGNDNNNIDIINNNYEQRQNTSSNNEKILLPFASHETMRRRQTTDPGPHGTCSPKLAGNVSVMFLIWQ
jgi:hypothetical protein